MIVYSGTHSTPYRTGVPRYPDQGVGLKTHTHTHSSKMTVSRPSKPPTKPYMKTTRNSPAFLEYLLSVTSTYPERPEMRQEEVRIQGKLGRIRGDPETLGGVTMTRAGRNGTLNAHSHTHTHRLPPRWGLAACLAGLRRLSWPTS